MNDMAAAIEEKFRTAIDSAASAVREQMFKKAVNEYAAVLRASIMNVPFEIGHNVKFEWTETQLIVTIDIPKPKPAEWPAVEASA